MKRVKFLELIGKSDGDILFLGAIFTINLLQLGYTFQENIVYKKCKHYLEFKKNDCMDMKLYDVIRFSLLDSRKGNTMRLPLRFVPWKSILNIIPLTKTSC